MRHLLLLPVFVAATTSQAFTGVVPTGFENTPANLSFSLSSTTTGRTYQLMFSATQMSPFLNSNLNGMQFRLNESVSSNYAGTTFTDFDIYLGEGVDISTRSSTFANNFVGGKTLVRSGGLTINPNEYLAGGSPVNPFGPVISFNNYLYTGGNLIIELRYSASSSATPVLDAVGSATLGYGTEFAGAWGSGITGTTATTITANTFVTQLTATNPVPEPFTMGVLGIAALAIAKRRKQS
ncbi:MAG: PEP-CTERM sorting domain-containing protein [Fimbriimonadaceae bacterium]|nr:MAG: PEP-CTERM sorting domain-containing protein [Fimbriimonadaceae bacterium]